MTCGAQPPCVRRWCGEATPHGPHHWQALAWCECPGVKAPDATAIVAAALRSYIEQGGRPVLLERAVRDLVRLVRAINANPDMRALVDAYAQRQRPGVEAPGVTAGGSGEAPRCGSRAGDLAAGPYIDPRPGRQPELAQPDQFDVDGEV